MALGKTRSRRDSFGLEVRPDGTLAFDFPREESGTGIADRPLSSGVAHGVTDDGGIERQRRSSRPQLHKAVDLRSSIGPLMRRRRRRDSFGLEVRDDGTLSFDQLASGGTFDLPRISSGPESDENIQGRRNGTRGESGLGDRCDSRHTGSSSSVSQSRRPRRRDSFGLEVRVDGTLSLDRLVSPEREGSGRERLNQPSRPRDQSTSHPHTNGNVLNRIPVSEATRTSCINAGTRSSAPAARGGGNRTRDGMGPTLGHREVQVLIERVRRLEAELARRGRPPTRDAMDAPPAYESRSGSPGRDQRQGNVPLRGGV